MASGRAGSLESLRRLNRLRVIHALRDQGLISRAEIARRTGLSRSTVSSLVSDLQADGLVVEREEHGAAHGTQGGRPPILLSFDSSAGAAVGIDFGHSHLRVAISDLSSRILAERAVPLDTDHAAEEGLDAAADLVEELLAEAGIDSSQVIGAGMGLPGPIRQEDGVVGSSAILPGWVGVPAVGEMRRRLDIPILVDNDANLGALAELHHGIARGRHDVVYLKVASGVGAGIVLGGRLHRGASGIAGEIGHVQVGEDGHVCRCGNRGCLETMVSAARLLELLRPAYDTPLTIEQVLALDVEGDAGVRRVLTDAGRTIGRAVADLANSLNPELVVVGGTLGGSPTLVDGLRDSIDRYAQPDTAAALEVVPGALGVRSAVVGAVALAIARVAAG